MAAKRMGRLVVHLVHGTWPSGVLPLPRPSRPWPPLWFEEGSGFREGAVAARQEILPRRAHRPRPPGGARDWGAYLEKDRHQ